jgi:hypothetical protein
VESGKIAAGWNRRDPEKFYSQVVGSSVDVLLSVSRVLIENRRNRLPIGKRFVSPGIIS